MIRLKDRRWINGYIMVKVPEHPNCMKSESYNGYVYEHRLVCEKIVGRYLDDDEEIHHFDGCKSNNNKDNLLVLLRSQHKKIHNWINYNNINIVSKCKMKEFIFCETVREIADIKRCLYCHMPTGSFSDNYLFCSDKCKELYKNNNGMDNINYPLNTKTLQAYERMLKSGLDKEVVIEHLKSDMSMVEIGKKFGYSCNGFRKVIKRLNINIKDYR